MTPSESLDKKAQAEWHYWHGVKEREGTLANGWYEYFYTTHFSLDKDFYRGKNLLDIGCGPRGSLEWATMAADRVGLDPLADMYMGLGAERQAMRYVSSPSERIPFPDEYFDVVCSFNSLDHVDDLDKTVREIIRVVRRGGLFLLLTDVNHRPTVCEPVAYSWDIVGQFTPALRLLEEGRFEKRATGIYQSLKESIPYDSADPKQRYGILSAKFTKP